MSDTTGIDWAPDFSEASWAAVQSELTAKAERKETTDAKSFNLGRAQMYADIYQQLPLLLPNIALSFLKRYKKAELAEKAFEGALDFALSAVAREAWLREDAKRLPDMYGKSKAFWSRVVRTPAAKSWGGLVRELHKKPPEESEVMTGEAEAQQLGMQTGSAWEMMRREHEEKAEKTLDMEIANSLRERGKEDEAVKYLKASGRTDRFIQEWRKQHSSQ
jgi:hypothetical protein